MLIRRQDIGVLLFYYLGYSKIRNCLFRLQSKPITRFVAFHDIDPDSVRYFESNLNFLKRYTNVISFDDYMAGRLNVERLNVVITFDDGFKSWITHALPILQKLSLPATFFISAGFVGLSADDETAFLQSNLRIEQSSLQHNTGGLTCDDVKMISDHGFTVGGHTLSHCNLSELHDSSRLKYEIVEDKFTLERLTGTRVDYFAYPLGVYHNPVVNIVNVLCDAGYKGAVTTIPGFNNRYTNPFLLHRELTGASMHAAVFKARVCGNYDAVQRLKQIMRLHQCLQAI